MWLNMDKLPLTYLSVTELFKCLALYLMDKKEKCVLNDGRVYEMVAS